MNIYTLICTRNEDSSKDSITLKNLILYFDSVGAETIVLRNKTSIFDAYLDEIKKLNLTDEDIIIMMHDDVEILSDRDTFWFEITETLSDPKVGFIGVAGSKNIGKDAVWWSQENFKNGKLRGMVMHGNDRNSMLPSFFGGPFKDTVIALDGLFLAAKYRTIRNIDISKPKHYPGEWDFYDILMTYRSWNAGYNNMVVPLMMRHESKGESMFTRKTWNENRMRFVRENLLPVNCK